MNKYRWPRAKMPPFLAPRKFTHELVEEFKETYKDGEEYSTFNLKLSDVLTIIERIIDRGEGQLEMYTISTCDYDGQLALYKKIWLETEEDYALRVKAYDEAMEEYNNPPLVYDKTHDILKEQIRSQIQRKK